MRKCGCKGKCFFLILQIMRYKSTSSLLLFCSSADSVVAFSGCTVVAGFNPNQSWERLLLHFTPFQPPSVRYHSLAGGLFVGLFCRHSRRLVWTGASVSNTMCCETCPFVLWNLPFQGVEAALLHNDSCPFTNEPISFLRAFGSNIMTFIPFFARFCSLAGSLFVVLFCYSPLACNLTSVKLPDHQSNPPRNLMNFLGWMMQNFWLGSCQWCLCLWN